MKSKIRKINVNDTDFLWRHQFSYVKTGDGKYTSLSKVTIYVNGQKSSPFVVTFRTWEDAMIGNPVNVGAPVDDAMQPINLNTPKDIRKIIEYALAVGWNGQTRITIENGFFIFSSAASAS